MKKLFFTIAVSAFTFSVFGQAKVTEYQLTESTQYKVVNKIKLEGDKGWDYIVVDDSTNRLFVSHGDRVQVLDLANSNLILATITGLNGVHGIALAPEFNKGFISSGRDSSVLVFDLKTYSTITKFKVTGANPDAILYDKFSKRVFTFNGRSNNSTVINAKTNAIIGTIDLPGRPEFAVSDGKGKIYDNLEDKNMICVIDASGMKVLTTWSIAPCEEPSGLAIDTRTHNLFSVCDHKIMAVIDIDSGKVTHFLPIGDGPDAVGFDAALNRVYASCGDGTLTVWQEKDKRTFAPLGSVKTQRGARTCTVNSKTHHIYLPTADFGLAPSPDDKNPHPRPAIAPKSFVVLDVEYEK